ncbi:ATP-binding protein [Streptomyces sp. NPDC002476]|uniref:ATP-binding protein n=1 Tax=Streptomyces sp. NPDC002476 TaxID=3364648 RepID=UPI0036AB591D
MSNSPTSAETPWEYTLHIPHDPRAVTVSRRTLRLILAMHELTPLSETAELVATELVGNAVRHTKGPAALRLHWADHALRIGVWDADPTPPAPPLQPPSDTHMFETGRGLDIVRNCTDGWGWHPLDSGGRFGKYVWCELLAA